MIFDDFAELMRNLAPEYGYVGIFLVSLLGASLIFVPIPSIVVIFILGGLQVGNPSDLGFRPLLIGVFAGLGATVGEFSGYMIGLGGRRVIGEKYKKNGRSNEAGQKVWSRSNLRFRSDAVA